MEGGYLRRRIRTTRRPGLPLENALSFYPTQIFRVARTLIAYLTMAARYAPLRRRLQRDLEARNYSDVALNPVSDDEAESLLLSDSEATRPGPPREARAS